MAITPRAEFEKIVGDVFRRAGWQVRRHPEAGELRADLLIERASTTYAVAIKSASEGRRDRLVPLLSQGILEAQSFARQFRRGTAPLAVVAARRIPASVSGHLKQFAERHAPNVAIGIVDAEGYRSFVGLGLDGLDAKRSAGASRVIVAQRHQPDLFSDLNQWMLKILVGRDLPADLVSVPRESLRNAAHLAEVANVSTMSASRFVNELAKQGFLDEDRERLKIVRIEELFERWVAACINAPRDLPARWIIKRDAKQFFGTVAQYAAKPGRGLKSPPRCCIGLFSAADALGLGFVRGVAPHLYLERLDPDVLQQLGLSLEDSGRGADVNIRIPSDRETIFRAAVSRQGFPVSDVLQVWLDTRAYPARGREQANEIWRRTLKPIFGKRA